MHRYHFSTWTVAWFFLSTLVIAAALRTQRLLSPLRVGSVREAVTDAGAGINVARDVTGATSQARPVPLGPTVRVRARPSSTLTSRRDGWLFVMMMAQGPRPLQISHR